MSEEDVYSHGKDVTKFKKGKLLACKTAENY